MPYEKFWRQRMSNQDDQKKDFSQNENDVNKFRDIEEAIQKAIKTESSKSQDIVENRKASGLK